MDWTIRAATAEDAPAIVALVRMLDDEEAKAGTPLTVDDVLVNGFGAAPRFRVLLAEAGHRATGYVLFSHSYDTEHAARGMYVNDLYVVPEARRQGIGRALMAAVARSCLEDGGRYLFWNALERNAAGRAFYRRIGAREEAVVTLSLQLDALDELAATISTAL
jgi:ribosomal protein S18 acetylase RimI-like enzyme